MERGDLLGGLAGDEQPTAPYLDEVVKRISRPERTAVVISESVATANVMAVTPREAFLGAAEIVATEDAARRISCESIAPYPPRIPAFRTINVLKEG
ncbi:MAG: hypothetical protein WCD11_09870 [Solirubrobacteraceae bacterium]